MGSLHSVTPTAPAVGKSWPASREMEGLLHLDPEASKEDVESSVPDSLLQNLLLKVDTQF